MEAIERTYDIPRAKEGEGPLTRHVRRAGAPSEGRLYGYRRIPRNFAGGVLGLLVVLWFFWAVSGYRAGFLVMLALAVAAGALGVRALSRTPMRASFDQRWRPKRRIAPLPAETWRRVAAELGLEFVDGPLPLIRGGLDGVAVGLAFFRDGGARTVATAVLTEAAAAPLRAFPRRAEYLTKEDASSDDPEFDRAWHLLCADGGTARRLLPPEARRLIAAAAPEEFGADGAIVWLRRTAFVEEPERARALLLAAAAMAGAAV